MAIDYAAIKAKLAQTKAGLKKAGTTIKPKQGKNEYVLAGPWNDQGDWHHNFGTHFIKDETDTLQAVYICADRTHGQPCTICKTMAEAQRTVGASNPEVSELIKKSYAAQQYLVSVLELNGSTPDTPQVLQLGKKAFEQLVTLVENWTEQVFDPQNPQVIIIERSGTTQNDTTYTVQVSPRRQTLKKPLEPINLGDFVKQESEAAEKKALNAMRQIGGLSGAPRLAAPRRADTPSKVDEQFEDVPDLSVKTPAAAKSADPVLTDDIDALLSDMNT